MSNQEKKNAVPVEGKIDGKEQNVKEEPKEQKEKPESLVKRAKKYLNAHPVVKGVLKGVGRCALLLSEGALVGLGILGVMQVGGAIPDTAEAETDTEEKALPEPEDAEGEEPAQE